MTTLEDFPADIRDDVRDFAEVFVRLIDSRDEITAERVGAALRDHECVRGGNGYYATRHQAAVYEFLYERLAWTYDEFRTEAAS